MKRKFSLLLIFICIAMFIFMDILSWRNGTLYYTIFKDNKKNIISPNASTLSKQIKKVSSERYDDNQKLIIKLQDSKELNDVRAYVNGHVEKDSISALDGNAYFIFDIKKCSLGFKNTIKIGSKCVKVFSMKNGKYKTLKIPINYKLLKAGEKNKISINAGVRENESCECEGKKSDNFYVKNVRLKLNDGTELIDEAYKDVELPIGDKPGRSPSVKFSFNIPESKFTSKILKLKYDWLKQGENKIRIVSDNMDTIKKVIFDTTPPEVKPKFKKDAVYKGSIKLDFKIRDKFSAIKSLKAELDDRYIKLPYENSACKLTAGKHVVKITAEDTENNIITENYNFFVDREKPKIDIKHKKVKDTIRIGSFLDNKYDVAVYKGYKYSKDDITIYSAKVNEKLPCLNYDKEKHISKRKYNLITKNDGKYLKTEKSMDFVYQRFNINVGREVPLDSKIKISWKGHGASNENLTLYAWNMKRMCWLPMDSGFSSKNNIKLDCTIPLKEYFDKNLVHVIIQAGNGKSVEDTHKKFTFAWMSDTQYYSKRYKNIYESITNWISKNKETIKYVIHSGDLVDKYNDLNQWHTADSCMRTLEDNSVPYGVLPGNHDVNHNKLDFSFYWKYFGANRFNRDSLYGGSYKNNKGHYDLISAGGNDFIVVYMGWGIKDAEIRWINRVLNDNREKKAILVLHEYLFEYGERTPLGNTIYKKIVMPNRNIFAVLCGHYHECRQLIDNLDDDGDGKTDRSVYQILADYQGGPEGGEGFIRLLDFDCRKDTIKVKTFSPYLNRNNYYNLKEYPDKDEFSIHFELKGTKKMVATDYFNVSVYTNEKVAEFNKLNGGDTIGMDVDKLNDKNQGYYLITKDSYGRKFLSDVYIKQ